jgi:hypothetical protein
MHAEPSSSVTSAVLHVSVQLVFETVSAAVDVSRDVLEMRAETRVRKGQIKVKLSLCLIN